MYRSLVSLCAGLVVFSLAAPPTRACNPRPCGVSAPLAPPVSGPTLPPPSISGSNGGSGGDNQVVWDLPEGEKQLIRKAARLRTNAEAAAAPASPSAPAPAPTVRPPAAPPAPTALPEHVARAVAAHKALALQVSRLLAKRAEIERWDAAAQEKFHRAFGTTSDQARQQVLQRIDQQVQEATRTMASLADAIRFDFYVAQNKNKR